jgi:hypothetical protein
LSKSLTEATDFQKDERTPVPIRASYRSESTLCGYIKLQLLYPAFSGHEHHGSIVSKYEHERESLEVPECCLHFVIACPRRLRSVCRRQAHAIHCTRRHCMHHWWDHLPRNTACFLLQGLYVTSRAGVASQYHRADDGQLILVLPHEVLYSVRSALGFSRRTRQTLHRNW